MSTVIGHRWRVVSYTSDAGTVRVPDDERTMLDFAGDGTLQISTPDVGDRLHYVRGRSAFWMRGDYYSYATVSGVHARKAAVQHAVHDLISSRSHTPVHLVSGRRHEVVLVTRNYRIRCVRADGEPMSVPPPLPGGSPSPNRRTSAAHTHP
jgi:hypothetical protein